MRTIVTFSPRLQESKLLSKNNLDYLESENISKAIIFSTYLEDGSNLLSNEMSEIGINSSILKMPELTTKGLEHSEQLKETAWKIVNNLFLEISKISEPLIYLGRGSRLHDHLLWLVGNIVGAKLAHWEKGPISSIDVNFDYFNSKLSPKILSNLIDLAAENKLTNGTEKYWFESKDIVTIDPSIQLSGVQAAAKVGLEKGFLEIDRTRTPPLYRLKKSGIPVGINNLVKHRTVGNKKMLITFGRLNPESKTINMLRYFNKIEPHDSSFFILQLIENEVDRSGVFSLSEIIETPEFKSLHEQTARCYEIIKKKSKYEEFDIIEPLFIVNPQLENEDLEYSFYSKLINHIREYELQHGDHVWTIDITSCMSSISYLASELSIASDSKISYVLKSKEGFGPSGTEIEESPFSRADHVIDVPSSIAVKALQNLNDKSINFLLVLMHHEQTNKKEDFNLDDLESILTASSDSDNTGIGLTKSEADLRAEELSLVCGYNFDLGKHPTRVTEKLHNNQLIFRTNEINPARFKLTDLGEFVAHWVYSKIGLKW